MKNIFFGFYPTKFTILSENFKMTNGEYIYRKTIDFMSRMALEKDDFRRFSVTRKEFRVTGRWVATRAASSVKMGL